MSRSYLDELEGDGIAFQDPWEFVMKEILSEDDYKKAYSLYFRKTSVTSEDEIKLKAWGAVISSIANESIPSDNMQVRIKFAENLYEIISKRYLEEFGSK